MSRELKAAVVVVRGTRGVGDVVTDLKCQVVPLNVTYSDSEAGNAAHQPPPKDAQGNPNQSPSDEPPPPVTADTGGGHGLEGMVLSAQWLVSEVSPALTRLQSAGYRARFTGHSLGAGVAALASVYYNRSRPSSSARCYGFGTPSCVTPDVAADCEAYVHSLVLGDDVVTRVTHRSVRRCANGLRSAREDKWVGDQFGADVREFGRRVGSVWEPRVREVEKVGGGEEGEGGGEDQGGGRAELEEEQKEEQEEEDDDDDAFVSVPESSLPYTQIPGTVHHMYPHRSLYRCSIVPRAFPALQEILLSETMVEDHGTRKYYECLQECQAADPDGGANWEVRVS